MSQNNETEIKSLADFEFSPNWEEKKVEFSNKQKTSNKGFRKKRLTIRPKLVFKAVIGNDLLEKIKNILRKDGLARNIANIAKDISEKKLYDIKIEYVDNKERFLVLNSTNRPYSKLNDLISHIIFSDKIKLICEENFTIEKEFDHVMVDEIEDAIFPPKSHNLFNNLIDVHILKNKIINDKKTVIEKLKTSRDKDIINNLRNETFQLCKFQLDNEKTFDSFDSIKSVIADNANFRYYTLRQKVKITAKEMYQRKELSGIKSEFERFYSRKVHQDINNCVKIFSKQLKFYIHNNDKEKYICAYQPKKFNTSKLNVSTNKIIQLLQKGAIDTSDLINQSTDLKLTKTDCLKEIKWLVKSGILRQYESGKIELTSTNTN